MTTMQEGDSVLDAITAEDYHRIGPIMPPERRFREYVAIVFALPPWYQRDAWRIVFRNNPEVEPLAKKYVQDGMP